MKKTIFLVALITVIGCSTPQETPPVPTEPTTAELLEHGKLLVTVGGCRDCHTPKIFDEKGMMHFDESRALSGHPEGSPLPEIDKRALSPGYWVLFSDDFTAGAGPWGITFARNLTPHETGIKGWTKEVFIKAIRTGQHMGIEKGRPIMPPMPWENLKDLPDHDLIAIFTYLQSLKPINNYVPEPIPASELL
ncbi:MAG: diheme cytochrome c-553 [Marinoscillum sp.]|uniref:diheme cytochrome c-553 n=1 Tax=Marinoscillum sp. TaxID=2024838 RepID=UPI003301C516